MPLTIRKAKINDLLKTFEWANEKEVLKNSIVRSKKVTIKEHSTWFKKYIKSKKNSLYIATYNSKKIGMVRIDSVKNDFFVGITIDKNYRKKRLSVKIFNRAISRKKKKVKNLVLKARIKFNNFSSIKMIEKLGFKRQYKRQNKNIILFKLDTKLC